MMDVFKKVLALRGAAAVRPQLAPVSVVFLRWSDSLVVYLFTLGCFELHLNHQYNPEVHPQKGRGPTLFKLGTHML